MAEKKPKKSLGLLGKTIFSLVCAGLVVLILYFRLTRVSVDIGVSSLEGWGQTVFWLAIFAGAFAFFFFVSNVKLKKEKEKSEEEKSKSKTSKKITIFVIISLFAAGIYIQYNYDTLVMWGLGKAIPAVAFFFGIVFLFLELFSFIKPQIFKGLIELPWNIMIRVIIPMMPFCIILLGVLQAWYPTDYPFLNETASKLAVAGGVFGDAFQKVVGYIYNLGYERPLLWFALTIGAFVVMLYWAVRKIFVVEPLSEEELPAEELIEIVKARDSNPKVHGRFYRWLNRTDIEEEEQDNLNDTKENAKVIKYDLELTGYNNLYKSKGSDKPIG